jgi:hypothetical protein
MESDLFFQCELTPLLLLEVLGRVPFMVNTENILLSNSVVNSIFLDAHAPNPYAVVGQKYYETVDKQKDGFSYFYVVQSYFNGRVLALIESQSEKVLYVDGRNAILSEDTFLKRIFGRYVVILQDDELVIEQVEYQLPAGVSPCGYYIKGDDRFYNNNDVPIIHKNTFEAEQWIGNVVRLFTLTSRSNKQYQARR